MAGKLKFIVVGLVLVAAAAGAYVYLQDRDRSGDLKLYGNVDVRQVDLSFVVEGRLKDMLVEEGDHVKAGQPLAHIERGYFEDALTIASARVAAQQEVVDEAVAGPRPEEIHEAKADVDAAKAQVINAQREYARQRELVRKKVSPQRAIDDARAALDVARGRQEAVQARLDLLEAGTRKEQIAAAKARLDSEKGLHAVAARRLKDTTLFAPADGVIMSRVHEPGAVLGPGSTVYTMAKTRPVWVRAFVPEPQLGRVRPGEKALVYTDARPGKPYTGHIGYISPTAEFTPKTVQTPELRTDLVFRFHVVIDDPDPLLRQGMPVTVEIK